jgi:GTP-binding protein
MEIKSAAFVISSTKHSACPKDGKPEYAFIGRSNVGKSSLINMLTSVKGLAKTSSKPGKTLLINHFLVNESWYIVDLPGYGYAKASKGMRENLHKMITSYLTQRKELACLFVLVDSRHEPMDIDLDFMRFLGEEGIPFAIVFTKTDKESQAVVQENLRKYHQRMFEIWEELPPFFLTSAEKKRGRTELLEYIETIQAGL